MPLPLILLALLAATAKSDWDLAVLTSSSLELLDLKLEQPVVVSSTLLGLRDISGHAYDPLLLQHYFAANGHPNASIFRIQVTMDGKVGQIEPVVKKQESKIYRLAYDAQSTSIFWTTSTHIFYSELGLGLSDGIELHNLTDERQPIDIAIDPCSRYIYWSCDFYYIYRSHLDGKNKERIVEDLHNPVAITISQSERRIYWVDEGPGFRFRIGRSLLDGSNKETVLEATNEQPNSIVVRPSLYHSSMIYWSDQMSHQIKLLTENTSQPVALQKFPEGLMAIASADIFDHLDNHVCSELIQMKNKVPYSALNPLSDQCVHGSFSRHSGECVCKPGYIGTLCEVSICYNFCLNGPCAFENGKPSCRCPQGWSGERCEKNSCLGYCYNGDCSLTSQGKFSCSCAKGWFGERCNISAEMCAYICANNFSGKESCNCNSSLAAAFISTTDTSGDYKLRFIVAAGVCGLLILCVVILLANTLRLRRRPRVKRFYKVTPNKGSAPQAAKTSPDCEIAIENCCNMNICETPCYEPELRPSGGRSKKEEKRGLLREMEVQPDAGKTF